ncbi:MAG TPA: hypothetical protein ENJ75_00715 [Candidatus Kaiserbacteria bacterium]|nr:hypothetical protein [Candidatus Kaiserbacteria bacterium]
MRLRLLIAALIFATILALLEWLALADFLYWRYVWFDTVMHFVGGLSLGTFIVALLPRFRPVFYIVAVAVLVVGWEVFEAVIGTPRAQNFFFDTSVDLLMDAIGATVAYVLARNTLWRSV